MRNADPQPFNGGPDGIIPTRDTPCAGSGLHTRKEAIAPLLSARHKGKPADFALYLLNA
jgi:hypothetical protein